MEAIATVVMIVTVVVLTRAEEPAEESASREASPEATTAALLGRNSATARILSICACVRDQLRRDLIPRGLEAWAIHGRRRRVRWSGAVRARSTIGIAVVAAVIIAS